jgi:hypothetical protein
VLLLATPERLRSALLELRPLATVRDHALLALRAAAVIDDHPAYIRMLLFLNELWQRQQVLEPEKLAATILTLDHSTTGIEHVVRGGQLGISPMAAFEHAAAFAAAGRPDAARQVLGACGGLVGLIESRQRSAERGWSDAVAHWAEATWYLSGLDQVLTQLDHHLRHPATTVAPDDDVKAANAPAAAPDEEDWQRERRRRDKQDREATTIASRNLVHARCFDLLSDARDDDALNALTAAIDAEASAGWRARARLRRAVAAAHDGAPTEVLRWVRELLDLDAGASSSDDDDDEEAPTNAKGVRRPVPLALRIRAAELLVRAGFVDAPEIDELVPPGTDVVWPSVLSGRDGLDPFQTLVALWRLRDVHPDPTSPPVQPQAEQRHDRDVGNERFRRALRVLAGLEGQRLAAAAGRGEEPLVSAHADTVIRLLEVPRQQTHDWTGRYIVRDAAPDLFRRLTRLAAEAGGSVGLSKLLDLFDDAWTIPERARFWSAGMQQAVLVAARRGRRRPGRGGPGRARPGRPAHGAGPLVAGCGGRYRPRRRSGWQADLDSRRPDPRGLRRTARQPRRAGPGRSPAAAGDADRSSALARWRRAGRGRTRR